MSFLTLKLKQFEGRNERKNEEKKRVPIYRFFA
jgi:hypothetical protein